MEMKPENMKLELTALGKNFEVCETTKQTKNFNTEIN